MSGFRFWVGATVVVKVVVGLVGLEGSMCFIFVRGSRLLQCELLFDPVFWEFAVFLS